MDKHAITKELSSKMDRTMKILDHELKGLRAGRASVNLLDSIVVDAYGNKLPLSQLATLTTPDAKTIAVQVWDNHMIKTVEKAIVDSNLGLTPIADGQLIRISLPPLTEERRKELVKFAHKYGESAKVSLRNARRDCNEHVKVAEKNHEISKDDLHYFIEEVQKLTDEYSNKIDTQIKQKEREILTV